MVIISNVSTYPGRSDRRIILLARYGRLSPNNAGGNIVTSGRRVCPIFRPHDDHGNSSGVAIVVDPRLAERHRRPAVLIHDRVQQQQAIRMNTNRGSSTDRRNNHGGTGGANLKPAPPWEYANDDGHADPRGVERLREDSTFTLALHEAIDWDDNCRLVIRHNTFDNSSITSHGADTSSIGARHVEIYNNTFIFTNFGDCDGSKTANLAYWIFMLGATGIIADNIGLTNMSSCAWGTKPALNLTVMNLQRNAGPNPCGARAPRRAIPVPRQVGMGASPKPD